MANPRNAKSAEELRGLLAESKTFFLVNYQGLSAGELTDLRQKVRDAGGRMLVAKNTLINLIVQEQGVVGLETTLTGPTALVLVGDDPVAPAKVLTDFAKAHARDLPEAKGGLMEGAVVDATALSRIAKLPPREGLQSELVGLMLAPLQQLVGTLSGAPRNLVSVLHNYSEKLKEA
ncbi:MAG: 50S ribosomal protein L10 [Deinococcota bacterium]|jgi:large subunit ribosomal protein L10|nr:50S ribosomal protein L10 [Deinococcota bacterium]